MLLCVTLLGYVVLFGLKKVNNEIKIALNDISVKG